MELTFQCGEKHNNHINKKKININAMQMQIKIGYDRKNLCGYLKLGDLP